MREMQEPIRDAKYFQRITYVPTAPIFIATSEDVGTDRAR